MSALTLEQFRATKREAAYPELERYGTSEPEAKGWVYADALVIEDSSRWPQAQGQPYYLRIANCEWFAHEIAGLEERLYQFYLEEF